MNRCVTTLPGCGEGKAAIMQSVGVKTLQDLQDYVGPNPPGVNMDRFKQLIPMQTERHEQKWGPIRSSIIPPSTFVPSASVPSTSVPFSERQVWTTHHTWYNMAGHIQFEDKLIRVRIGEYVANEGTVWVHWGLKKRQVTPQYLASIHVLWLLEDVVSDGDDDDDTEEDPEWFLLDTHLGAFQVHLDIHTETQYTKRAERVMREVQHWLDLSSFTLLKMAS